LAHAINARLFVALRSVARDHNITNFDAVHIGTDTLDNTCGFMTKDTGPVRSCSTATIKFIDIGVAKSIGEHFDSDLSFFGRINGDGLYFESFFRSVGDGCLALDGLWFLH